MHISPIRSLSKGDLQTLVDASCSISEVLRRIGFPPHGANFMLLKKRLLEDGIGVDQMRKNAQASKRRGRNIPLKDILCRGTTYNRVQLKKRLIVEGLLKNKCSVCGLEAIWNNKKLVMILDHINGENDDNRIDNLRLVCPNCNSQTDTFSGRNQKREKFCLSCGTQIANRSSRCRTCYVEYRKHGGVCQKCGTSIGVKSLLCLKCCQLKSRVVHDRPTQEELREMLTKRTWRAIGKQYGVSDNAVRKWAKSFGIL